MAAGLVVQLGHPGKESLKDTGWTVSTERGGKV